MTDELFIVRRYAHSRLYSHEWRCLHAEQQQGVNPRPVQCLGGGLARGEDAARAAAEEHAATHHPKAGE